VEGQRDAVLVALAEQEAAGIDIVTDGEQGRQHFVHGFLAHVEGVDFARRVTIGIRADRYKAEVPTVVGTIHRPGGVHSEEARFARAHTRRPLKFTLPGPMTIVDTLADEHYRDRARLALAFARVINEEARELVAAGLDVLQLDEPAFNVYMDDVAAWGIEALHRATDGLRCRTAVHICYGYGIQANVDWKKTLGAEWRQYERTFPLLAKSRIDQVSLECANSRVPLELLELLRGKDVMAGVIDVATREVETPEQVAETIRRAVPSRPRRAARAPPRMGGAQGRAGAAGARRAARGAARGDPAAARDRPQRGARLRALRGPHVQHRVRRVRRADFRLRPARSRSPRARQRRADPGRRRRRRGRARGPAESRRAARALSRRVRPPLAPGRRGPDARRLQDPG